MLRDQSGRARAELQTERVLPTWLAPGRFQADLRQFSYCWIHFRIEFELHAMFNI